MNCQSCEGACCETFYLRDIDLRVPTADVRHWVRLHAISVENGWIEFPAQCSALDTAGRCSIYEDRPQVCRDYKAGGVHCLEAVRKRRERWQYEGGIAEAGDPPADELYGGLMVGANALP